MNYFKLLFAAKILLIIVNAVSSQKIGFGSCPQVTAMEYFSLSMYVGEWYEYARYTNYFQFGTSCVKAEYEYDELGDSSQSGDQYPVYVKNSAKKDTFFKKGNDVSVEGKVRLENPNSFEAKLRVNFNGKEGQYWIIDTDYINYSLVWSCTNYWGFFHLENLWILTTFRHPPKTTVDEVYDRIASNKILQETDLTVTNQDDCYY